MPFVTWPTRFVSLVIAIIWPPRYTHCLLHFGRKNVTSPYLDRTIRLRHDRVFVDDFISLDEARSFKQLIMEFENDPYFIRLYKGLNGTDARRLLLDPHIYSSSKAIQSSSSSSSSHMAHRRYRGKRFMDSETKHINTTRLGLIRNFVTIFDKIVQYVIDAFNQDLVTQTVGVSIRDGPWATIHQKYPGLNTTLWNQPPHVDQCYVEFTQTSIRCRKNTYLYRDYSVVLYLNEVEGGDFMFLDFPDTPIDESVIDQAQKPPLNNQHRSLYASTSKEANYIDFEELGIFKKGEYTVIPPRPGRLLVFQSGLRNIHAVTEIFNPSSRRYTFAMWLLDARRAEHIQPPEPTAKPETG